jgi:hypothetical protein
VNVTQLGSVNCRDAQEKKRKENSHSCHLRGKAVGSNFFITGGTVTAR